jgi:hypothetical protein
MLKIFNYFEFKEKGTTLVEIAVVMFIITMFSLILINDFPKILRQFAVSRSAYKLSQDIRRVEDLGLSGVKIVGQADPIGGYGLYIDKTYVDGDKQYKIYADNCSETADFKYTSITGCQDYIVETIIISEMQAGVYIKEINGTGNSYNYISINFTPPNPKITITEFNPLEEKSIDIVIGSIFDSSLEKTVSVNTSGLIEVK